MSEPARRSADKPPKGPRADAFRRTRSDHRDELAEDYCEAILEITERAGEARVRDLARMMGVSHVTVTRTIARLALAGLVRTEPYRPVTLTPAGKRLADSCRERHRVVLEVLLALGVARAQAEIDAEGIEHHVSDVTIRAMRQWLAR